MFARILLTKAYQSFTRRLLAKGVQPETQVHYQRAYNMLQLYFKTHGLKYVNSFGEDDWYDLTLWLAQDRNPVTVNTYLRGIKSILKYSCEKYGVPKIDNYQMMKVPEREKEIYSAEDIQKLIASPTGYDFVEVRGWMLSCLLVFCAPRAKTICSLKVSDFDLHRKELHLRCLKSKKIVIFPLTDKFVSVIERYLIARSYHIKSHNLDDGGAFLCDKNTGLPVTRYGLYKMQSAYNLSRGVNKTGLHVFRNNFAKSMIENGCDAFTLQRWMTHQHIKSTEIYVNLYSDDLRKTIDAYNPFQKIIIEAAQSSEPKWQQLSFFGQT